MRSQQRGDRRPAVLVIAATDSSGGAGLTRDVRVLTDFSTDALCVVTAVTAQSDKRVTAIHHVPPEVIRAQVSAALETRRVGAIKLGMLGTRATVEAVAESLQDAMSAMVGRAGAAATPATTGKAAGDVTRATAAKAAGDVTRATAGKAGDEVMPATSMPIPVVVDPVLVSSSGGVLLDAAGRTALLEKVLPLATLVTPNVPEVAALLGEPVATDEAELIEQGRRLLELGCRAILLKGGHAVGEEAVDLLIARGAYDTGARDQHGRQHADGSPRGRSNTGGSGREAGDRRPTGNHRGKRRAADASDDVVVERITSKRVPGSSRGTGCALASGIAAGLASGLSLLEACQQAKHYVLEMMLTPSPNER